MTIKLCLVSRCCCSAIFAGSIGALSRSSGKVNVPYQSSIPADLREIHSCNELVQKIDRNVGSKPVVAGKISWVAKGWFRQ